jgi:hypothetical protein
MPPATARNLSLPTTSRFDRGGVPGGLVRPPVRALGPFENAALVRAAKLAIAKPGNA